MEELLKDSSVLTRELQSRGQSKDAGRTEPYPCSMNA